MKPRGSILAPRRYTSAAEALADTPHLALSTRRAIERQWREHLIQSFVSAALDDPQLLREVKARLTRAKTAAKKPHGRPAASPERDAYIRETVVRFREDSALQPGGRLITWTEAILRAAEWLSISAASVHKAYYRRR